MTALFKELLQCSFQLAKSPGADKHFRDGRSHRLVTFATNFQNASSTRRAPVPESPPPHHHRGGWRLLFCIVQNNSMRSAGPHTAEAGSEAGRRSQHQVPTGCGTPAPPDPRPARRPGRVSLAGSAPCRPRGARERGRSPQPCPGRPQPCLEPLLPRGEQRGCGTPCAQGTPVCRSHSRGQAQTLLSIELHTSITGSSVHHKLVNKKKKKSQTYMKLPT